MTLEALPEPVLGLIAWLTIGFWALVIVGLTGLPLLLLMDRDLASRGRNLAMPKS